LNNLGSRLKKDKTMALKAQRRRITAIIEYPDGILVTLMRHMLPTLPGGGIKYGESEEQALARELYEETRLQVVHARLLFHHETYSNQHAVYTVEALGTPEAAEEVDALGYYRPGGSLKLAPDSLAIMKQYQRWREENQLPEL
jgi:8-oxo-dGTP pyrophosphatase MutT (NUDIX family)